MMSRHAVKPTWIAACGMAVVLLVLPFVFRLDGHPHADWQQFLGRFHPSVVHLPIALVLLVPLFEIAGYFRTALREAASVLLALALPACLLAVLLGYLLAYGGGTAGPLVTTHLWLATILSILVMACLLSRPAWAAGRIAFAYPALVACAVVLVTWTGHQGGSITYGKNYLTEFAPFKGHGPAKGGTDASFYGTHLQPVLDANCVACHSDSKAKGGLRLDTYSRLMRGGAEGPVIVAGKPDQSIFFKRITLPPTDKHFMPTDGKPPLKPEEIAWIRAWIQDGAPETAPTVAGITIAAEHKDLPLPQVGDYSKLSGQIAELEKALHVRITPVSMHPGDGLMLDTTDAGHSFSDAQLAQLTKLAPYIVEAQLARTNVTDAAFDTLATFSHLRALHLDGTPVTGSGLHKIASLKELTYLNLSGTRVTSSALTPVKSIEHLYLFNTPAQPAP